MAGPGDERERLSRRLCQILIEARETADLTQAGLGKALGRTQSFVSNYERGQRKLGVPEFIQIADALELEPTELLARIAIPLA
jgi:transcriptional regulator with XRE-family HTH domain